MPQAESQVLTELRELRARLAQLEERNRRRPKHFNQKQAAEYLNCSEEWLRRGACGGSGAKTQPAGALLGLHRRGFGRLRGSGGRQHGRLTVAP